MLLVIVFIVVACVLLNLVIPPRPAWMQFLVDRYERRSRAYRPAEEPAGAVPAAPWDGGLFDQEFVQQRLDLVAAELRRLDEVRDGSVFALAFRSQVAEDAYRALLDDASRLAAVPTLALGELTLDEDDVPVRGPREELQF